MESAIPKHLRTKRTCPFRHSVGYSPSYPSRVAHFDPAITHLVMAYFGIQYLPETPKPNTGKLDELLGLESAPRHWDRAQYVDEAGYKTLITVAYWDSVAAFEKWKTASGFNDWWASPDREAEPYGYFQEVYTPRIAAMQATLFTAPWEPEGVANLSARITDDIVEHSYWGAVYDRIPLTQTEWLKPEGQPVVLEASSPGGASGKRRRVRPAKNLCLIRSGQDWSKTTDEERSLYLDVIQPELLAGMNYLRDDGLKSNCYTCRMLTVVDDEGRELEKTYGLALFRSIDDMSIWASSHPTHNSLFSKFMDVVQKLNFDLQTSFYHEVAVVDESEQFYEYINCHSRTGMLRASLL